MPNTSTHQSGVVQAGEDDAVESESGRKAEGRPEHICNADHLQ